MDVKDLGNGWVLRRGIYSGSEGTNSYTYSIWSSNGGINLPGNYGEIIWSALEARDQQTAALQEVAEAAKRINWTPDDGSLTQALAKARALGALKEE